MEGRQVVIGRVEYDIKRFLLMNLVRFKTPSYTICPQFFNNYVEIECGETVASMSIYE